MSTAPILSSSESKTSFLQPILSDSKEHIQEALTIICAINENPEEPINSLLGRLSPTQAINPESSVVKLIQTVEQAIQSTEHPLSIEAAIAGYDSPLSYLSTTLSQALLDQISSNLTKSDFAP